MSIEIKCDRCGKPLEPEGEGIYTSRVTPANIIVAKNGHGEMHDLCDDCLQKLDIFMSGKMPDPEYKSDELVYLELPNPNVCVFEKGLVAGQAREPVINISADLEPISRLIEEYRGTYIPDTYVPTSAIKQVILGVQLR